MLILNPITTESNSDTFLDGPDDIAGYTRLMEFRSNDQLNRLLSHHEISLRIKTYDLHSKIIDGDFVFSDKNGIAVLSIGVSSKLTEEMIENIVDRVSREAGDDDVFFSDEMNEVPGASRLFKALIREGVAQGMAWKQLREHIIKKHKKSVETDHRKEVTP